MVERDFTQQQALLIDSSERGRLVLTGKDNLALLQRLSTNELLDGKPGEGRQTVLTTPIGRIIDLLLVLSLPESIIVQTSPGRGGEIESYLRGNIFFMDEVQITDRSEEWGQLDLYGARATELLEGLFGTSLAELPLFSHSAALFNDEELRLARIKPLAGGGWTVLGPREQVSALQERLLSEGAAQLDATAFDILRVEAGQPQLAELNREYIPLETGLWDAVSFSKGCYVGQEIIARMESRGRLAKRLMGLRLAAVPGTLPARLTVEGKEIGDLTSAVNSARFGPIGLGYVRSANAEPGSTVFVEDQPATVVALPFE